MTGLLTDLMHDRADHLDAPALDLAEITRDGDRRVRRRRTAVVGGLAAAAAVVALAVPSLVLGDDDPVRRDLVADGTTADPQPLSWITGSTLHRTGQEPVDLGVDVRAWVWVGDDIAFTDARHRVHLWTGDALDVVGRTADVPSDRIDLVSDGSQVGWVDAERGFTVYDVDTRLASSTAAVPSAGEPAEVTALDGATLYGTDSRGTVAWRRGRRGRGADRRSRCGAGRRGGDHGPGRRPGNRAVLSRDGQTVQLSTREFANLSPDGALVAVENDDLGQVVDATTGEARPFEHGHEWAVGYQWLDPTTLAVLAFDGIEDDTARTAWLLTCDGRTGSCQGPGTDVPAGFGDFQLPMGVHFTS